MGSKVSLLRERSLMGKFSFFAMDMDYHTTTTTRTLEVLDALVKGFSQKFEEVWLSGSSHGGYVILNYIKLYRPNKVRKIFLFAPSYSTLQLTIKEIGEENCRGWLEGREDLKIIECETGLEVVINREFAVDIRERGYEIISNGEVSFPSELPYDIYVFHGVKDNVVPVEHSRLFTDKVKVKHYSELEDDHGLSNTFKHVMEEFL